MKRVHRTDYGVIQRAEMTPQGTGLIFRAFPSRAGVLHYAQPDGTIRREYRPREEVFAPESLATLSGAPLTDRHPPQLVTADTWRDVTRGHVLGDAAESADRPGHIECSVAVMDGETIRMIDEGERIELSLGYTADLEDVAGVSPDGEPYDAIQRSIRANHLALLGPGEARGGPTCALRVDSNVRIDGLAHDSPPKKKDHMARKTKTDAAPPPPADDDDEDILAAAEGEPEAEPEPDDPMIAVDAEIEATKKAIAVAQKKQQLAKLKAELAKLEGSGESTDEPASKADARDPFAALAHADGHGTRSATTPRKRGRSYQDAHDAMEQRIRAASRRTYNLDVTTRRDGTTVAVETFSEPASDLGSRLDANIARRFRAPEGSR